MLASLLDSNRIGSNLLLVDKNREIKRERKRERKKRERRGKKRDKKNSSKGKKERRGKIEKKRQLEKSTSKLPLGTYTGEKLAPCTQYRCWIYLVDMLRMCPWRLTSLGITGWKEWERILPELEGILQNGEPQILPNTKASPRQISQ